VQLFGGGDYAMRIWLDPSKLAARNLTAGDVVAAIRNRTSRWPPPDRCPPSTASQFQLQLNVKGRLTDEQQFRDIIIKTGGEGEIVRVGDVGRVEIGAQTYSISSLLDNKDAVAIPIFQAPNSNACSSPTRFVPRWKS